MADDPRASSLSVRSRVWVPLLVVVGTLLIQAAWSLALPPFRGTDEFDHAFRAASVAEGQWVSHWGQAENGRGVLVRAPRSMVLAASPVCSSYEYTGPDNCFPVKDLGHGDVQVACAATSYNPLFYWVLGTTARSFDGATALYVMRLTASLLCALMLGLAAWVTSLWARSWWPLASAGLAFTPVAWFSVSIVAPNGLEICAGLTMWLALLGLATERGRAAARPLLVAATLGAAVLVLLRPLGPLWVAMILLAAVAVAGPRRSLTVVRHHARLVTACASAIVAVGIGVLAWMSAAGAVALGGNVDPVDPLRDTLGQVPLWFLQGVAAFPRRGDAAPLAVYALAGLVLLGLLLAAAVLGRRGRRWPVVVAFLVALAVPMLLSVLTIRTAGAIWQGRYGMPFHVGVALLAGLALEGRYIRSKLATGLMVAGGLAVVLGNVVAVVSVFGREHATSPLTGSTSWITAPAWFLAGLVVAGFAASAWAAVLSGAGRSTLLASPAPRSTREASASVVA